MVVEAEEKQEYIRVNNKNITTDSGIIITSKSISSKAFTGTDLKNNTYTSGNTSASKIDSSGFTKIDFSNVFSNIESNVKVQLSIAGSKTSGELGYTLDGSNIAGTIESGSTQLGLVNHSLDVTLDSVYKAIEFKKVTNETWIYDLQLTYYTKDSVSYRITYVSQHGEAPEDTTGSKIPELVDLTADGYRFDGWFTDSSYTNPAVEGTALEGDVTLYAKWVAAFDVNYFVDGEIKNTVAIEENNTIGIENAFTYTAPENYTFSGWYSDEACEEEPFDFANTVISADTNIYGKTTENHKITVTYNYNYDEIDNDIVTYYLGETISQPANPVRSGYIFKGWNLNNDSYTFGETVNNESNSFELVAQWELAVAESITITNTTFDVVVGQTLQINTAITPYEALNTITYDSTNKEVATIDETGLITGKSIGTSTITVTTDNGKTDSCEINVVEISYKLDANDLAVETISGTKEISNSIFKLIGGGKLAVQLCEPVVEFENATYNKKINTGGSSTFNSANLIEIDAPSAGKIVFITAANGDTGDRKAKLTNENTEDLYVTEKLSTTPGKYIYNIDSAGKYYLGSTNSGVAFFSVEFIENEKAQLNYQYDNDVAPTAIRFIATLSNITDYKTIESLTFNFAFDGNAANPINITTLYTSVANTDFVASDYTYYVVYAITNIPESALNKSFEATLTIDFTEESGISTLTATRSLTFGVIEA